MSMRQTQTRIQKGWTEEEQQRFDQGLRMLARMIAADILKKRTAAYKNEQESKNTTNPQSAQNLPEITADMTATAPSPKKQSRKRKP